MMTRRPQTGHSVPGIQNRLNQTASAGSVSNPKKAKSKKILFMLVALLMLGLSPVSSLADTKTCNADNLNNCFHNMGDEFTRIGNSVKDGANRTVIQVAKDVEGTVEDMEWFFNEVDKHVTGTVGEVTSMIDLSYQAMQEVFIAEYGEVSAFLGDGNECGVGSPCDTFKSDVAEFLRLAATVNHELIDFYEVLPPDFPTAHVAGLAQWVTEVPGFLLYPLYRAAVELQFDMVQYSWLLEEMLFRISYIKSLPTLASPVVAAQASDGLVAASARQGDEAEGLEGCGWTVHPDTPEQLRWIAGVSAGFKGLGILFRAAGKTTMNPNGDAFGAGAVIKSNWVSKIGLLTNGIGDIGLVLFAQLNRHVNRCKLSMRTDELEADVRAIIDMLCNSPWYADHGNGRPKPKPAQCYE